ncbi:MAG: hypothetical protein AAFZ65_02090 [Planctomycetota bacterium]
MGRSQRTSRRRSVPPPRRWRAPVLLPLSLLGLPLLWILGGSRQATLEAGYGWLDPEAIELELPEDRTDPRWEATLQGVIREFGPVALDDGARIAELRRQLEALSFVAETDDPRVVWPAGVEFPIRLRRPVACVTLGERFLTVDDEGVLLEGDFLAPPRLGAGHLPVLAPVADGRFDRAAPGDSLSLEADLDALSIASAMWEHLSPAALELLGRITIDARAAPHTSVSRAGAILALEGRRSVAFGRAPRANAGGSLPVESKWAGVAYGLQQLVGPDARDWVELDVRFDEPTFEWRRGDSGSDGR